MRAILMFHYLWGTKLQDSVHRPQPFRRERSGIEPRSLWVLTSLTPYRLGQTSSSGSSSEFLSQPSSQSRWSLHTSFSSVDWRNYWNRPPDSRPPQPTWDRRHGKFVHLVSPLFRISALSCLFDHGTTAYIIFKLSIKLFRRQIAV